MKIVSMEEPGHARQEVASLGYIVSSVAVLLLDDDDPQEWKRLIQESPVILRGLSLRLLVELANSRSQDHLYSAFGGAKATNLIETSIAHRKHMLIN